MKSLTTCGVACMAFGLFSLNTIAAPPELRSEAEAMDVRAREALWTGVLARHADEAGRIDFAGLQQDHGDLDRIVAFIAVVDPVAKPQRFPNRASKLAFYINAYNALAMHEQLDRATRAFLEERRNVRPDPAKREVCLSAVFDFYAKDFPAHAPDLVAYANRYRSERIPADWRVRLMDYDWSVNERSRGARR